MSRVFGDDCEKKFLTAGHFFTITKNISSMIVVVIFTLILFVSSYENGVAQTPIMGFNTWNYFGCNINETMIIQTMDGLVKSGLSNVGYKYVNIDDCWSDWTRDPVTKRLRPNGNFPNGIQYLAKQAHDRGLKLGIYSDLGTHTCTGRPGSAGYYELDSQTFAEWGIDLLKFDFCSVSKQQQKEPWIDYGKMSKALNETGRPMVFSICNWGFVNSWEWAPKIGNMWRITKDIWITWSKVMRSIDTNKPLAKYAGPSQWNDPDMLEVGVFRDGLPGLTLNESISHFSLWCMMASPLITGIDLRDVTKIEPWVLKILSNKVAIQVNQDILGKQGYVVEESKGLVEIWIKPLQHNSIAVLLFNRGDDSDVTITVQWHKHLSVNDTMEYNVRDVWSSVEYGVYHKEFTTPKPLAPHSVMMLIFTLLL
jgi:alpha-galactosidase